MFEIKNITMIYDMERKKRYMRWAALI